MMELNTDFLFIALYEITKTVVKTTTTIIQTEIDRIGGEIGEKISYKHKNDNKLKKYVISSLGGLDNIVLASPYKNGYMFVFFDLSKVDYYHFKNLGARVWVSEKRGSIILKPKEDKMLIGMDDFFQRI